MTSDSSGEQVTNQVLGFVRRTSDLVGILDDEGQVVFLNDAARKRLGVGDSSGLTSADMFPPEAFVQYYEEVRPALLRHHTWRGELGVLTESGTAVPMDVTAVADVGPGGEVRTLVAFGREIGRSPAPGAGPDAAFDALTGLPGRAALDERLRAALAHRERGVAVIFAAADGLQEVNDEFGRAAGDDVLRTIARVMSQAMRTSDTVARVGGDEFAVLLEGLEETDTAWEVTERLRDAVSQALAEPGEDSFAVTARFGLAVADPGEAPAALLQRAESAMSRAKSLGSTRTTMSTADPGITISTLTDELALAVSHGLIHPYVQPVVDLRTGTLVGYQGLARWEHPQHGLLDADEFVHLVASTPILPVIDLGVLRRTAAAAARRARNGLPIHAYGHLSRRLLGDADVEHYLVEIIDDLGVAPSDLCIEIAQTMLARPSRTIESALRTLREIGLRIVLTGVDGEFDVNQIVDSGFDELRLERRLVRDAARDPSRRQVARGTIALAHALGLTVIAVGIENEAEHLHMLDAGCDSGEGNLFGSVQPADAVDER